MSWLLHGARAEPLEIGGVSLEAWIDFYNYKESSGNFPDGRSYLEQPAIAIAVFNVIASQIKNEEKADALKRGTNRISRD